MLIVLCDVCVRSRLAFCCCCCCHCCCRCLYCFRVESRNKQKLHRDTNKKLQLCERDNIQLVLCVPLIEIYASSVCCLLCLPFVQLFYFQGCTCYRAFERFSLKIILITVNPGRVRSFLVYYSYPLGQIFTEEKRQK